MQSAKLIEPAGRIGIIRGLFLRGCGGGIGIFLFSIVLVGLRQAQFVDVDWEGPSGDPLQVEL
jgi:hypothetical protein